MCISVVCLLPVGLTHQWQRNGAKIKGKTGWLLYYLKKDTYVHDCGVAEQILIPTCLIP
jgi:hypothetical protein